MLMIWFLVSKVIPNNYQWHNLKELCCKPSGRKRFPLMGIFANIAFWYICMCVFSVCQK